MKTLLENLKNPKALVRCFEDLLKPNTKKKGIFSVEAFISRM